MKKYHINKLTLALTYGFVLFTFFIIISILSDVGIMRAVDMSVPIWKKALYYFIMGGSDLMLVGFALYLPLMVVTRDDSISIIYLFQRSRNKHLPLSEIDHIDYPVIEMSMGRPHRVIEIVCKDGQVVKLDISFIRFTKYLDTLKITRRLNNDILWF